MHERSIEGEKDRESERQRKEEKERSGREKTVIKRQNSQRNCLKPEYSYNTLQTNAIL